MTEPHRRSGISWPAALVLSILILALAVLAVFWFIGQAARQSVAFVQGAVQSTVETAEAIAGKVRQAFSDALQMEPRIVSDGKIISEQTSGILELATAEKTIENTRDYENTWMGSTKTLRVRATYHIKAGFDLNEPFTVEILPDHRVHAHVPAGKILSVEQRDLKFEEFSNGYWNPVEASEIEDQLARLEQDAVTKAQADGLERRAERELETRLAARLGPAFDLRIDFAPAPNNN